MSIKDRFGADQLRNISHNATGRLADGSDAALAALEEANILLRDGAQQRPLMLLAGGFAAGMLLGLLTGGKASNRETDEIEDDDFDLSGQNAMLIAKHLDDDDLDL